MQVYKKNPDIYIGTSARTKIEGWDCTFAMDWQIIPQSNNTQTAGRVLLCICNVYCGIILYTHCLFSVNLVFFGTPRIFVKFLHWS